MNCLKNCMEGTMIRYVCSINVSEGLDKRFTLLEGIVIESKHPMTHKELKTQVINHVPEKYINFGPMTAKETMDE